MWIAMELIVELLNITTGGNRIAILSEQTANLLGVHSSDRIKITYGTKEMIAIANIAQHFPRQPHWAFRGNRSGA